MTCYKLKLSLELGNLVSGCKKGIDFANLPDISLVELFEFSGLTRSSWCESLNISDSLWAQYRTGGVKVPRKLWKEAVRLSFLGAAVRIHAAKIIRKTDL